MARRGTKPKPAAAKKREGSARGKAQGKRVPKPTLSVRSPAPDFLDAVGKAKWRELHGELESQGVVTTWDHDILAAYCEAWSLYQKAQKRLRKEGYIKVNRRSKVEKMSPWVAQLHKSRDEVRKTGALLGLNPSDRCRLDVTKTGKGPRTQADQFFAKKAG